MNVLEKLRQNVMVAVLAQDVVQLFVLVCGWYKGHGHVEHMIKTMRRDPGHTSWTRCPKGTLTMISSSKPYRITESVCHPIGLRSSSQRWCASNVRIILWNDGDQYSIHVLLKHPHFLHAEQFSLHSLRSGLNNMWLREFTFICRRCRSSYRISCVFEVQSNTGPGTSSDATTTDTNAPRSRREIMRQGFVGDNITLDGISCQFKNALFQVIVIPHTVLFEACPPWPSGRALVPRISTRGGNTQAGTLGL